jgi:hypothetical protein
VLENLAPVCAAIGLLAKPIDKEALYRSALVPGRIRASCPDQCIGIGIRLAFRWAMIQMEPPMTRKTISTPNARARMLFV